MDQQTLQEHRPQVSYCFSTAVARHTQSAIILLQELFMPHSPVLSSHYQLWSMTAVVRVGVFCRVMSKGKDRFSIPFFYEPAFYSRVECLPNCCSEDNPAMFPPTFSGQHVLDKYAQTHASFPTSWKLVLTTLLRLCHHYLRVSPAEPAKAKVFADLRVIVAVFDWKLCI